MRELVLKWLPVFGLIIAVTYFLPCFILGLYHSFKDIMGYSNERLRGNDSRVGLSSRIIFSAGLFSILGGVFSLSLVSDGKVDEIAIIGGIFYGGLVGPLLGIMVKLTIQNRHAFTVPLSLITGILGGICAWIGGGAAETPYGRIIGTILGMMLWGLVGGMFEEIDDKLETWIASVIVLIVFGVFSGKLFAVGLIPMIGDEVALKFTIGLAIGIVSLMFPLTEILTKIVSFVTTHILIFLRHKSVLCNQCLQYTNPFQSRYKYGTRYCEHWDTEVESTRHAGKLYFTFGEFTETDIFEGNMHAYQVSQGALSLLHLQSGLPSHKQRAFNSPFTHFVRRGKEGISILSNPDFDQPELVSVEVSAVYIDTKTCNRVLVERFLTYIVNYPPKRGLSSVQVFYRGTLDELGDNLKNALQNTFQHVEQIH